MRTGRTRPVGPLIVGRTRPVVQSVVSKHKSNSSNYNSVILWLQYQSRNNLLLDETFWSINTKNTQTLIALLGGVISSNRQ